MREAVGGVDGSVTRVTSNALVAFLNTVEPAVVLAVPRVRLAPATVAVPAKIAALEMVWPLMRPEVVMVDIPLSAPELIISPLMVLTVVGAVMAPAVARVPLKLAELEMVWKLMRPEVRVPTVPLPDILKSADWVSAVWF